MFLFMNKKVFSLRNVAVIFACLAIVTMFSSCKKDDAKQITAFGFTSPSAMGVINEATKTIVVNVPAGTDITALIPTIVVSAKASVSPAAGVVQNFSVPVMYTVTAEDNSTVAYVVTVIVGGGGIGSDGTKQITDFRFMLPFAVGVINETEKTIVVKVPHGTNVTALKPTITVSDKATVNPGSEVPQNFSVPVIYTVMAADYSLAIYTVTVIVAGADEKSTAKQITNFRFTSPSAVGTINETAKTITVEVPASTNVTALQPTITVSDKATINPASGVAQNFTNPVSYTVTAEDNSTATYTVTVIKPVDNTASVRFNKEDGYANINAIGVLLPDSDTILAYYYYGIGAGTTNYVEIRPGNHIPGFIYENIEWRFFPSPYDRYNFQAGYKYTLTIGDDGTNYVFSISNDGQKSMSDITSNSSGIEPKMDIIRIPKGSIKSGKVEVKY